MRNLKRVLSLALALVMMLGMMIIGANAASADFADADEITYTEAVDVMAAIGVLEGDGTNFNPTDILTREQAAAIICRMLVGPDTASKLGGDSVFEDVAADSWSAPVIAYCNNLGIIAGYGDGNFGPKDELTGLAFAKMLLVALGNDPVERGYVGSNWATAIAVDAIKAELDLDGVALTAPLTREQASQMAFEALNYTPDGASSEYVVFDDSVTVNGTPDDGETVYYRGNDAITALLMQNANSADLALVTSNAGSLGDTVFGLTETTKDDAFGRTSTVYTNGETGAKKVTYTSIAPTPVLTYSAPITKGKLAADLGCTKASDEVSVTVVTDGTAAAAADFTKTMTATSDALNGNGSTVEVYAVDGGYKAIVINTYVATLDGTTNTITAAKAATATEDAQPAKVTIDGVGDFETDAFKKDDVVLYTKGVVAGSASIQSMEKATVVTGKIAKYVADKTVTVGGTTYAFAANTEGDIIPTTDIFTAEYAFYVDGSNNVYKTADVDAVTVTADGIFYVDGIQVAYKGGADSDLFGDAKAAEVAVKAKVVTLTGEVQVIDVDVYSKKEGSVTKYYYVNETGTETEITAATAEAGLVDKSVWVAYTVENGEYTFQALTTAAAEVKTLTAEYVKGTATMAGKYMTSDTVYTYINTADKAVKTVTGYKNIEIADGTTVLVVYADAAKTIVKNAYVLNETTDASGTTATYAYAASTGATVADGTEWTFYVDGEVKVLPVKLAADAEYAVTELAKDKVYDLRIDNKGVVTGAKAVSFDAEAQKVTLVTDGYVVADDTAYNFADNYAVYNVTTGNAGTADTIEVDDYISIVLDSSKVVLVYIVNAPAAP